MARHLLSILLLLTAFAAPTLTMAAEEGQHKHHVGLFLGGTHTDHDDGVTVGLEYEYRLSPHLGVGLLGEYADLGHDVWVLGVPFVLHPHAGWRFLAMPGAEITEDHDEFLFRLGVGYDFHAGDWTLTPGLNVDFVDGEENLVFGIAVGRSF